MLLLRIGSVGGGGVASMQPKVANKGGGKKTHHDWGLGWERKGKQREIAGWREKTLATASDLDWRKVRTGAGFAENSCPYISNNMKLR